MGAYHTIARVAAPLLFWPLDEPSGTVANDRSDNGRGGTANATGVTPGSSGPPDYDGATAWDLDGTTGYVSSTYSGAFGGGNKTFELWARQDTNATSQTLIAGDVATVMPTFQIPTGTTNVRFRFQDNDTGATSQATWTGVWPGASMWVHVVLIVLAAAGTAELFINGVSQGVVSGLTLGYNASPGNFKVGAKSTGSTQPWDGRIALVGVYSGALAQREITAHYKAASGGVR